jgi:hypothetical protein
VAEEPVVNDYRATCAHEAGHAAGLVFQGRLPVEIRVDRPTYELAGRVRIDPGEGLDRDRATDQVVMTLLGPIMEPQADWPPAFPPDSQSEVNDVRALGLLVGYLKLTESDWRELVAAAHRVADDPNFKSMHALIANALEHVPVITGEQLRDLIGPERVARYLNQPTEREESQ